MLCPTVSMSNLVIFMLTQWVKKVATVAEMDAKPGLNAIGCPSTKLMIWFLEGTQTFTCGKLITMGPFHNRGVDDLSLQEKSILDLDLFPLPVRPLLESC